MVRAVIIAAIAAWGLAGCASTLGVGDKSEFACNKKQDGYGCGSTEEVYKATNSANYQQALAAVKTDTNQAGKPLATAPASNATAAVTPMNAPNWPAPVLEPASVLRIWIAPWVDDRKALHWPSYVFAEVTPRKWSFGNMDFRSAQQLVPLQVDAPRKSSDTDTPVQPLHPPQR